MIRDFVANRTSDSGTKNLRRVGELAMLGDVLDGGDIKARNDRKANILKAEIERRREAELENRGLIMPTDWDTLLSLKSEAGAVGRRNCRLKRTKIIKLYP